LFKFNIEQQWKYASNVDILVLTCGCAASVLFENVLVTC